MSMAVLWPLTPYQCDGRRCLSSSRKSQKRDRPPPRRWLARGSAHPIALSGLQREHLVLLQLILQHACHLVRLRSFSAPFNEFSKRGQVSQKNPVNNKDVSRELTAFGQISILRAVGHSSRPHQQAGGSVFLMMDTTSECSAAW